MALFTGFVSDRLRRNVSQWLKTFDIHRHVGLIEIGQGSGAGLLAGRWLEAAVRATEWDGDPFLRQRASGMLDRILGAQRSGPGAPFPWMTRLENQAMAGALEAAADLWQNGPAEALLARLALPTEASGRFGPDAATAIRTTTVERLETLLPDLKLALERTGDGIWGDALESLLWNQVFACQSLEGDAFYAATPLHGVPSAAGAREGVTGALMLTRIPWMFYSIGPDSVQVLQYGASDVRVEIGGPQSVELAQLTSFPDGEEVSLEVRSGGGEFNLQMRIPRWCQTPSLRLVSPGEADNPVVVRPEKGFFSLRRKWQRGDKVMLRFPMAPTWSQDQAGSFELRRGPLLYCFRTPGVPRLLRPTLRPMGTPTGYPGPVYEVRVRLASGQEATVLAEPFACAGWGGAYQTALSAE
jgi:DUF1680 family protein